MEQVKNKQITALSAHCLFLAILVHTLPRISTSVHIKKLCSITLNEITLVCPLQPSIHCNLLFRWHTFPPRKDVILLTLSSSACEMLLFIKGRFQILQEQLASSIFSIIWKNLAQALNKCIYEEVSGFLWDI